MRTLKRIVDPVDLGFAGCFVISCLTVPYIWFQALTLLPGPHPVGYIIAAPTLLGLLIAGGVKPEAFFTVYATSWVALYVGLTVALLLLRRFFYWLGRRNPWETDHQHEERAS
jgi:hypothetical protein